MSNEEIQQIETWNPDFEFQIEESFQYRGFYADIGFNNAEKGFYAKVYNSSNSLVGIAPYNLKEPYRVKKLVRVWINSMLERTN